MATIVCQGLQSCLESHLVEPRTLRLKLSSSVPLLSQQPHELLAMKSLISESSSKEVSDKCQTSKNSDMGGGWSFLQALSNGSQQGQKLEKESLYVHPLVKRSASTLSEKSLSLCTENLGSETGTDIIDDGDESNIFSEISVDSTEGVNLPRMEEQREKQSSQCLVAKKAKARSFPPPLTTISGRDSLHVRPHREDGRLIIKAVKAPSKQSCFQAERTNGRLRLCLLENYAPCFDYQKSVNYEEENEGVEEDNEKDSNIEEEEEEEEDIDDNVEEQVGEGKAGDVGSLEEEEQEEMDGNFVNVGAEMGVEKYESRPRCSRRCKQGSDQEKKTLLNWEPLWVAS
ncbi:hypothetical protein FNV43_RR01835 [Rhamnella rubrinervis]|uniref:FAF domain-containing protein n=1 Tax=Rhamnella rubrinervis TaxID=2594499 RepID=A0A8K0MTC1_9ROSA|nr:hypothetical protein FNV43_RR01835 [Rhamnella rubrinervis]